MYGRQTMESGSSLPDSYHLYQSVPNGDTREAGA